MSDLKEIAVNLARKIESLPGIVRANKLELAVNLTSSKGLTRAENLAGKINYEIKRMGK